MPPTPGTADEWIKLIGRAALTGSPEVRTKLAELQEAERNFYISNPGEGDEPTEVQQMQELHNAFKSETLDLIDEVEQMMRDEVAAI